MATKSAAARLHLLTARQVHSAPDGDHGDGGGLQMRVSDHGRSASWVLRYTSPTGRRREMGLGQAVRGSVAQAGASLTGARDAAHEARDHVRKGVDPLDVREQRRQATQAADARSRADKSRERWTLARCARDYHERVIERSRTAKHSAQWISSLENHVPAALWHAPIAEVTPPQLMAALEAAQPHERARRSGDLSETLRRCRQRLDSVFEDAIFHGRATSNPAAACRRKLTESRPAGAKGQLAALPYVEAPALLARVRGVAGVAARCLEFAVLTASRTSEALLAEWTELDLDGGVWIVPADRMKLRREHRVHLSPRVKAILQDQRGHDKRYVFPSPQVGREGKPLSNMAMLATLDRLGVRNLTTVHGLARATFSTWANETGAARSDVIEAALAHQESDRVRRAYNRSAFDAERRALLAAWSDYLARPALELVAAA